MKLYTLNNEFIEEVHVEPDNFTGIIEYQNKSRKWLKNGLAHREDGPAREYNFDYFEYNINDITHRWDGPALIDKGKKYWFIFGKEYTEEQYNNIAPLLFSIMKLKGLL